MTSSIEARASGVTADRPARTIAAPRTRPIAAYPATGSAKLLADTYTHVLMDTREIDYAAVIAERLGAPAEPVPA